MQSNTEKTRGPISVTSGSSGVGMPTTVTLNQQLTTEHLMAICERFGKSWRALNPQDFELRPIELNAEDYHSIEDGNFSCHQINRFIRLAIWEFQSFCEWDHWFRSWPENVRNLALAWAINVVSYVNPLSVSDIMNKSENWMKDHPMTTLKLLMQSSEIIKFEKKKVAKVRRSLIRDLKSRDLQMWKEQSKIKMDVRFSNLFKDENCHQKRRWSKYSIDPKRVWVDKRLCSDLYVEELYKPQEFSNIDWTVWREYVGNVHGICAILGTSRAWLERQAVEKCHKIYLKKYYPEEKAVQWEPQSKFAKLWDVTGISWLKHIIYNMANPPLVWEPQSGKAFPDVNFGSFTEEKWIANRSRIQRIIENLGPMSRKHLDKMKILCHYGRFSYLTNWDLALYNKQVLSLQNAFTMLKFSMLEQAVSTSMWQMVEEEGPITPPCTNYWDFAQAFNFKLSEIYTDINNRMPNVWFTDFRIYVNILRMFLGLKLYTEGGFEVSKTNYVFPCEDVIEEARIRADERQPRVDLHNEMWRAEAANDPVSAAPSGGGGGSGVTSKESTQKPVTSGEQKESLVMADQREVEKATPLKTSTKKKETLTQPEVPWDIASIAKRPMMLDRFQWGAKDDTGKEIKSYVLPQVYFSAGSPSTKKVACTNLTASYLISLYGLTRFNMKLRVQVNTTKFQAGLLLCYFKPFYFNDRVVEGIENSANVMQYPHLLIDASVANSGEIMIPFTNPRDYFPVYHDWYAGTTYFGTLHFVVWNALRTGENTSGDTTVTLWAELDNLELHQLSNPKPVSQISFADKVLQVVDSVKSEGELLTLPEYSNKPEVWQPQMEALGAVAGGMAADVSAKMIEALLSKLTSSISDKPTSQAKSIPVIPRITDNCSFGEGVDSSQRLSLHPISVTPQKGKVTDMVSPASLNELITPWSRMFVVQLSTETAENDVIATWAVGPGVPTARVASVAAAVSNKGIAVEGGKWVPRDRHLTISTRQISSTNLGYFNNMFYYWRGDIKFKFQAVCTGMHSTRLFIRYEPMGTPATAVNECERLATPGVVWDIQEQHELEVVAPYMASTPFLSTQQNLEERTPGSTMFYGNSYTGFMQMQVVNKLKRTTGVSGTIDINVYVAAGDNFEFACLREMSGIATYGSWGGGKDFGMTFPGGRLGDAIEAGYKVSGAGASLTLKDIPFGAFTISCVVGKNLGHPFWNKPGSMQSPRQVLVNITKFKEEVIRIYTVFAKTDMMPALPFAKSFRECMEFVKYKIEMNYYDSFWTSAEYKKNFPNWATAKMRYMVWMAVALCGPNALKLKTLPSFEGLPFAVKRTQELEWRPESNDNAKGPVINPFKDGLSRNTFSSKGLIGESYMGINDILRRYYHVRSFNVPSSYDGRGDTEKMIPIGVDSAFQNSIVPMSQAERERYCCAITFPVTPMLPPHMVGKSGAALSFIGAGDVAIPVSNFEPLIGSQGFDSMNEGIWNPIYHLAWRYTFWRGSMRYKIVFPKTAPLTTVGDNVNWNGSDFWAAVVHHPVSFTPEVWNNGRANVVSQQWMRHCMNQGTVLYNSNIAGSIEVEVPYYSRYSQLHLSPKDFRDITTNGSVTIFVPISFMSSIKIWSADKQDFITQSMPMWLFMSCGADFEFSIPRPAPIMSVWSYYFKKDYNSKQIMETSAQWDGGKVEDHEEFPDWGEIVKTVYAQEGKSYPLESMNDGIEINLATASTTLEEANKIQEMTVALNEALIWVPQAAEEPPIRNNIEPKFMPQNFDEPGVVLDLWEDESSSSSESESESSSSDISSEGIQQHELPYHDDYADWFDEPVELPDNVHFYEYDEAPMMEAEVGMRSDGMPYSDSTTESSDSEEDYEPQALDEEGSEYGSTVAPADEVDALMDNLKLFTQQANVTVEKIAGMVQMVGPSLHKIATGVEAATDAIKQSASKVGTLATYSINAVRLSMFAHGVYRCLKAEGWSDRWFAIAECALALGLDPSLMMKVGEWLMGTLSTLLGPLKVNEGLSASMLDTLGEYVPEADDDGIEGTFSAFVDKNVDMLKMIAASIAAIATFYFTSAAPQTRDVSTFASRAISKLKNFTIVGTAIKTFDWLFKWIAELLTKAVSWACDKATGGLLTHKLIAEKYPLVVEWLMKVETINTESERVASLWDADTRNEMWRLMDTGQEFAKTIGGKNSIISSAITRGLTMLQKCHDAYLVSSTNVPFRIDPWVMSLTGEPGVGKSTVLLEIMDYVADEVGMPKFNRWYTRGDEDEFWPNYKKNPGVLIDDLLQNKKSKLAFQFINMCSNLAFPLPMAEITEKGRHFESDLIGFTKNKQFPEIEGMADINAFLRREKMACWVRSIGLQTPDKSNLRFDVYDPLSPNRGAPYYHVRDLTLPQVKVLAALAAKAHLKKQKALVFSMLSGKVVSTTQATKSHEGVRLLKKMALYIQTNKDLGALVEKFKRNISVADVVEFESNEAVYFEVLTTHPQVGKLLRELKKIAAVNVDETSVKEALIAMREPESEGDDEYEPETWEDKPPSEEEREEMFARACKDTDVRGELAMVLKTYQDNFKNPNVAKYVQYKVPDKDALKRFVHKTENLDGKDAEKVANDYYNIWESVCSRADKRRPLMAVPSDAMGLFRSPYKEKWKKKDATGNVTGAAIEWEWVSEPFEGETEEQREFRMLGDSWFEELTDTYTPAQIAAMVSPLPAMEPKGMFSKAIARVVSVGETCKNKVVSYLQNHPWIAKLLKTMGLIIGVFVGYKIIRYICPGIMDKIEDGLAKLLGYEGRVQALLTAGELSSKVVGGIRMKTSEWYSHVKSMMTSSKDPKVQEMASESGCVKLYAEELERMLPTVKSVVAGKKLAAEAKTSKGMNAYMIGNQDKGEKITLSEYIPHCETWLTTIKPEYVKEGASDKNAHDLRTSVLVKSMVRAYWIRLDGSSRREAGVFVRGRTLLMPWHFFDGMQEGTIFHLKKGTVSYLQGFDPKRLYKFADCDVCLYECSLKVGQFPDITNHFIKESDLVVSKTKATLSVLAESDVMMSWITDAELTADISYNLDSGERITTARCWNYEVVSSPGDCGAVLLADNCSMQRKLLGIHVCGVVNKNIGASAVVTREMLDVAFEILIPDSPILGNLWAKQNGGSEFIPFSAERMKVIPQGNFELVGAVASHNEVQLPRKTEILMSPIHDKVREHVTEPAVLNAKDPRLEVEGSPLVRAISKYGVLTLPFNNKDIKTSVEMIKSEISEWKVPMGKRVLTDWEAVFGNEHIEFCDRMNLAASPGFPYIKDRPSGEMGKAYLFNVDAMDGIACDTYRKIYRTREALAHKGLRMVSLWTDCLKDERRPIDKIKKGKTRAFVLPPADFTQLFRKYFMAFNVCFYANHNNSFSAVGIDPYSYEWTVLYKYLASKSNWAFGGDFHSFDGILDAELMWQVFEIIDAWYGNDGNRMIRAVLWEELIHTAHICLNGIYIDAQGNPSGSPETVILNTIVHYLMILLAWFHLARKHSPPHLAPRSFYRCVKSKYYGDDGNYTVVAEVSSWFNLKTVSGFFAEHGIEYTDEKKTGEMYGVRPLRECTFLKNGFKRLHGQQIWCAPIATDTIYELTNWIKKSHDPLAMLRDNIEDSLGFAFHHGRDFYDRFLRKVNDALEDVKMREFVDSYDMRKEQFLSKCK